jgi:hypothetical protein
VGRRGEPIALGEAVSALSRRLRNPTKHAGATRPSGARCARRLRRYRHLDGAHDLPSTEVLERACGSARRSARRCPAGTPPSGIAKRVGDARRSRDKREQLHPSAADRRNLLPPPHECGRRSMNRKSSAEPPARHWINRRGIGSGSCPDSDPPERSPNRDGPSPPTGLASSWRRKENLSARLRAHIVDECRSIQPAAGHEPRMHRLEWGTLAAARPFLVTAAPPRPIPRAHRLQKVLP